jgi:hypothetical protein
MGIPGYRRRPLERRAVGQGIGVWEPHLEQVGSRVDRRDRDGETRLRVRIPGDDERDEGSAAGSSRGIERRADPFRAGGAIGP